MVASTQGEINVYSQIKDTQHIFAGDTNQLSKEWPKMKNTCTKRETISPNQKSFLHFTKGFLKKSF